MDEDIVMKLIGLMHHRPIGYPLLIYFVWSLVIKLHCGQNLSRISASELDLWLFTAGTRQPGQKIGPKF